MKLSIKISLVAVCAVTLHAELLIIKKQNNQWSPLDDTDEVNKDAISQVMLKYQWPMVVRSDLTPAEQDELFNDPQPYAEERFMAKRIKTIDPHYDVVFVPTSVYELFTINYTQIQAAVNLQNPSLSNSSTNFLNDKKNDINVETVFNQAQQPLPGQEQQAEQKLVHDFYQQYDRVNEKYYPDLFFEINNACMEYMIKQVPMIQHMSNGLAISQEIQPHIGEITASLVNQLNHTIQSIVSMNKLSKELALDSHDTSTIRYDGILFPVINLEYQARQTNKAFLLRGTPLNAFSENNSDINIATTTLDPYQPDKIETPYSMSFGNSLFAGIINDLGACAYQYISNVYNGPTPFGKIPHAGFAVMIDKKDCYHNPKESLFFIPPLTTLSGLVASGEWFHPRLKAADPTHTYLYNKRKETKGIVTTGIKDPLGIFYTDLDPVEYAKKYSMYAAEILQMLPIEKPSEQQPQDVESSAARYGFIHPSQVHSVKVARVATDTATQPIAENQRRFVGAIDRIFKKDQPKDQTLTNTATKTPKPVVSALPASFNLSDHIAQQNSTNASLPTLKTTASSTDEKSYVPDFIDITTMPKPMAQNSVPSDMTTGNTTISSQWLSTPTDTPYLPKQYAQRQKINLFIPEEQPFIVSASIPPLAVSSQTTQKAIKAGQKMLRYA